MTSNQCQLPTKSQPISLDTPLPPTNQPKNGNFVIIQDLSKINNTLSRICYREGPPCRFADSYRRKFTEQEFNALKRQCETKHGQKSACIVTVKKEHGNERHTVLKSVVGTLDVSIRPFLHGETFPGEKVKATIFFNTERKEPKKQYGYIANLCVAKSARRQGIARNMLHFAINTAMSDGVEQVYVHVHRKNIAAQELYKKIGFKIVDLATPQLSGDKTYLLCYMA
ncbi:unnamed protein product [Lactuca virosa]|uniref:N-acetyltransferase domain-containing protein n=1 Tax=Lactuca virosa TaxID=75947 RepID=A0AAU9LYP8_9ASTR|nr:unnamed protein product [Lactuca virosa]